MGKRQIKQQMAMMDHNIRRSLRGTNLIDRYMELLCKINSGLVPPGVRGPSQKLIYRLRVSYLKQEISRGEHNPSYEDLLFSASSIEDLYENLREAKILRSNWTKTETKIDAGGDAMDEKSEVSGGRPHPLSEESLKAFESEPILGSDYQVDYLTFELTPFN